MNSVVVLNSPDTNLAPSGSSEGLQGIKLFKTIGIVAWRDYIGTFGKSSEPVPTDRDTIIAPFESASNPLDIETATRDLGYALDWMRWLAGKDNDGKILSADDCDKILGCVQKYAEFVLSTRQLPSRVPYDTMSAGILAGMEHRPQYYITTSGRILTSAPDGKRFTQGIHIPQGRVGGFVGDTENDGTINIFFKDELRYKGLREASQIIGDSLSDLSAVAPGFYQYVEYLKRLHDEPDIDFSIEGYELVLSRVEAVALLMKVLYPEETAKWGGNLVPSRWVEDFKRDIGMVDFDLGEGAMTSHPQLNPTTVDTCRVGVTSPGGGRRGARTRTGEIDHGPQEPKKPYEIPKTEGRSDVESRQPIYPIFDPEGDDVLSTKIGSIWARETVCSYPDRDSIPMGNDGCIDTSKPEHAGMVAYLTNVIDYLEKLPPNQIAAILNNAEKIMVPNDMRMYETPILSPLRVGGSLRIVGDEETAKLPSMERVDTEFASSEYVSTMNIGVENMFLRYRGVVCDGVTFDGPIVEVIVNFNKIMDIISLNKDMMRRYFNSDLVNRIAAMRAKLLPSLEMSGVRQAANF